MELQIAANPDPSPRRRYLIRVPLDGGLLFTTSGIWPHTKSLQGRLLPAEDWPEQPDLVDTIELHSCVQHGSVVDLVATRNRDNRSQLVFSAVRGRDIVIWQSPHTTKRSRPPVRTPDGRSARVVDLPIVIGTSQRSPYDFAGKAVTISRRALPCGDYGLVVADRLVAAIKRMSLKSLASSLLNGTLSQELTELSTLPRAAVVVDDRYSGVFSYTRTRPGEIADRLAELHVTFPNVAMVFCQSPQHAEEYIYRYLNAARAWAHENAYPITTLENAIEVPPELPESKATEIRTWARAAGYPVSVRGPIPHDVHQAWRDAQQ